MNQPSNCFTTDRIARWFITIAILVGIYLLLDRLSTVLLPFFLAWLSAYLLNPIVILVEKWTGKRALSVLLTLLSLGLIFSILLVLFIPVIIDEFHLLNRLLSEQMNNLELPAWIPKDILEKAQIWIQNLDVANIIQQEGFVEKAGSALSTTWSALSGVFGVLGALFGIVTYFLYLVFIMIDYELLSSGWQHWIPDRYKGFTVTLVDDLSAGMNGYFRAQTKIVVSVSILFAIGFKLIGLPFGIMLGIMVGLLNYIPYMQLVGLLPAVALAALHSLETGDSFWMMIGLVLAVFAVVQLLQDAFLTPRIMGDLTGMNPAIVLLSLSIWGSLLGMVGLIIGIPLTSLVMAYYNRYILKGRKE